MMRRTKANQPNANKRLMLGALAASVLCGTALIALYAKSSVVNKEQARRAQEFLRDWLDRARGGCLENYTKRQIEHSLVMLNDEHPLELPKLVMVWAARALPFQYPVNVIVMSIDEGAHPIDVEFMTVSGKVVGVVQVSRGIGFEREWGESLVRLDDFLVSYNDAANELGERAYHEEMPDLPRMRLDPAVELEEVLVRIVSRGKSSNHVPIGPVCRQLSSWAAEELRALEKHVYGNESIIYKLREIGATAEGIESFDKPVPVICITNPTVSCETLVAWLEADFQVTGIEVRDEHGEILTMRDVCWSVGQKSELRRKVLRTLSVNDVPCDTWLNGQVYLRTASGSIAVPLATVSE